MFAAEVMCHTITRRHEMEKQDPCRYRVNTLSPLTTLYRYLWITHCLQRTQVHSQTKKTRGNSQCEIGSVWLCSSVRRSAFWRTGIRTGYTSYEITVATGTLMTAMPSLSSHPRYPCLPPQTLPLLEALSLCCTLLLYPVLTTHLHILRPAQYRTRGPLRPFATVCDHLRTRTVYASASQRV